MRQNFEAQFCLLLKDAHIFIFHLMDLTINYYLEPFIGLYDYQLLLLNMN